MKKTEERDVKLEGQTLSYFKSKSDLEANKKGKTIDLNKATITLAKKEEKGKIWITITTSSKKKREIAAKSKDDADTWLARLTQASAGAAASSPTVNKEKVTEEKPAKETKVKEEKKRRIKRKIKRTRKRKWKLRSRRIKRTRKQKKNPKSRRPQSPLRWRW